MSTKNVMKSKDWQQTKGNWFLDLSSKIPGTKIVEHSILLWPLGICKCPDPLQAGSERFQEAYPEIQGHWTTVPYLFLEIVILRFVSRAIWRDFDGTRLSTSWSLHSSNFLKSKSVESFTIMVHCFRKSKSAGILKSKDVLIYVAQKWLQWRRPALVLVPQCYCRLFRYQLCSVQLCMKQQTRLEVT